MSGLHDAIRRAADDEARRVRADAERLMPIGGGYPSGRRPPSRMKPPPPSAGRRPGAVDCPDRHEVTAFGSLEPVYLCGCGRCAQPERPRPTCLCGHRDTHRSEPGIGCTTPGCLCLEPTEPEPRPLGQRMYCPTCRDMVFPTVGALALEGEYHRRIGTCVACGTRVSRIVGRVRPADPRYPAVRS